MSDNGFRAQSALEFLMSYSWAILIISIVMITFVVIINIPRVAVPTSCIFASGVECRGMLIGSNTFGTLINLVVVNGQQYDLINPSVIMNLSPYGTTNTICTPSNAIAGSAILCTASLQKSLVVSTQITGTILFNATVCLLGNFNSCQAQQQVSYIGNFSEDVGTYTSPFQASITLMSPANAIMVNTPTKVIANVKVLGLPYEGAMVTFATPSSANSVISPQYALTDPKGNATGFFTAYVSGNYAITANAFGMLSTNTLTVVPYT